jgi:hypothetical protein
MIAGGGGGEGWIGFTDTRWLTKRALKLCCPIDVGTAGARHPSNQAGLSFPIGFPMSPIEKPLWQFASKINGRRVTGIGKASPDWETTACLGAPASK